jgi:hypothetical protein
MMYYFDLLQIKELDFFFRLIVMMYMKNKYKFIFFFSVMYTFYPNLNIRKKKTVTTITDDDLFDD